MTGTTQGSGSNSVMGQFMRKHFWSSIPPVPPQALAAFHISVGAAILAGDSKRFSGPTFAGARQLAQLVGIHQDYAWLMWGATLTAVGIGVLFLWPWLELWHARIATCVVLFGAAPLLFIVIGFITSVRLSEIAASSGIGAYGSLCAFHLHTAYKMIQHGSWDRRQPDGTWERRSTWHPRARA